MQQKRPVILAYLSCIRYKEVLVLHGTPLMGIAFTQSQVTREWIDDLLLFSFASFCLLAHIFAFNDWAGIASDFKDPNKTKATFLSKGLTRAEIGGLSLGLGLASLAFFSLLPLRTLVLAVGIVALGLLYSHPQLHGKGIPVISSCLHLVGGVLHFLLGYSVFEEIDRRGVLIALFFAFIFTAGHLSQEVRDYEGDSLNGILTNGVRFGKRKIFMASFLLFTLSYGHLWGLSRHGLIPAYLGYLTVLYPIHAVLFWKTLRAGLTFETIGRLQTYYRTLYALIGLAIGVTLLPR